MREVTVGNEALSAGDLIAWIESHCRHSRERQVVALSPGDIDDLELNDREVVLVTQVK